MDLDQLVDKTANKENKMKVGEALETLKKYNKWRRGKGKKYAQPGFPADLTPELIGQRRSNSPTSRRSPFARWRRLPVRLQLTLLTDESPSATEEPSRRDCGRLASRLRHHSRFRIQRYLWTVER